MVKYYPFELHTHTDCSDGFYSVGELVDFAKERGLTGIAKTDHNTISGNELFVRLCREAGIVPLAGLEISNRAQGDALVLGEKAAREAQVSSDATARTFAATARRVKKAGGCVGYAHPFRYGELRTLGNYIETSRREGVELTHIEIWNGMRLQFKPWEGGAEALYAEILCSRPIAAAAGSDFHEMHKGGYFPVTYLGIEGEPCEQSALGSIYGCKTYIAYGYYLPRDNAILPQIGGQVRAGGYECKLVLKKAEPRLGGNSEPAVIPLAAQIIVCNEDGGRCVIFDEEVEFENGEAVTVNLHAELPAGARFYIRVTGTINWMPAVLLITSPVQIIR